jgi:hypothetical protein
VPILVPAHLAAARRTRPSVPRFGVYVTLAHVAGRTATVADLTHALVRLRRSDVVRWLAAISGWIDAEGGMELANQLRMADQLLAPDLRKGLDAHLGGAPDVRHCVFLRRQIWFVLQMAVVACQEETPECSEDALRHAVGECLLMASDLLQRIEPNQPPGSGPEEANKWTASVVIPIADGKDYAEILARAQSFWFDLPGTPAIRQKAREIGVKTFDDAFAARYGLPLREFFLVLLALYGGFEGGSPQNDGPRLLDEATYLRPGFADTDLRLALALVSQTPDELAIRLLGEPRQNWATDGAPLRGKPVIQVFPGQYACPDRGLLYRALTDVVYYLLQRAYPEGRFGQLFGYVFEQYVHGVLREFTCESAFLARSFYASPKFRGTTDEAGDALLYWEDGALHARDLARQSDDLPRRGDTAVLMEYKARLLSTREKYAGIPEATLKGIDDILGTDKQGSNKGVAQLAKNLARILRGERLVSGPGESLDLSGCKHIIPTVIAYEELVALEAVRQQADAKLRAALQRQGADPNRIGPLLLLSIDDLEVLEDLARQHRACDVVHDYVGSSRSIRSAGPTASAATSALVATPRATQPAARWCSASSSER